MKLSAQTFLALCLAGSFGCGMAFASEAPAAKSHWYCVSESPSNMQSGGHIGYGHGATKSESASKAVDACKLDGGDMCANPECFPE